MMHPTRLLWGILIFAHTTMLSQNSLFRVVDYGAVGDGKTINTIAIQKAIDKCAELGGGTVSVPAGVFLSGTVRLRSHVNLQLASGGVLRGSERLEDYILDGTKVGLLFTQNAEDVSITGFGTIDGNGDLFMDLAAAKKIDSAGTAWTRQKKHFREVLQGIGDGPVVPKDRPFQMIIFSNCRDVTLRDVHVTNAPFWTIHCADCDGVVVSGLTIRGSMLFPNNDGIDFTSCSNVRVSDCDIRTGDDCIVLTGYDHHFDLPGYNRLSHPSENITVTNCTLQSRSAAIRIGGFDQNPMRNYLFSNIVITNSNRGIGIFARDQGTIENLMFTNIIIETRLHTGDWWGQGEPIHISAVRLLKNVVPGGVRNVTFRDVACRSESGILVYGTPESIIEDVSFENLRLKITCSPLNAIAGGNFDLRPVLEPSLQIFAHDIPGLYAQWVKNFLVHTFSLSWESPAMPFFSHAIELVNFQNARIFDFAGTAAPGSTGTSPVALTDGTGFMTDLGHESVKMVGVKSPTPTR
jgi:polygalacturonase